LPNDPRRVVQLSQLIRPDPDPKLGYRLRPGACGVLTGAIVRINGQGFRSDPVAIPKPPKTLRVVGLGDSTMFGLGVVQTETYLELLEAEFKTLLGRDWKVEFVNTAVPAYNTVQEVEMFLTSGLPMEPDAVLIQFDRNDLLASIGWVQPDFLRARHLFVAHPPSLWMGFYSDITAFILLNQQDRLYKTPTPYSGWDAVENAYRRLAAICRERGIPLLAVLICEDLPPLTKPSPMDPTHARILKFWREQHIAAIETLPTAEAFLKKNRRLWSMATNSVSDPHPNRIGHALTAQAVLPTLRDMLLERIHLRPGQLEGSAALGNAILRQMTSEGLHETEQWGEHRVNWTMRQARFQFLPAGKKVSVPFRIGPLDVSAQHPVEITLRIEEIATPDHPAGRLERDLSFTTQTTRVTQVFDISRLAGCPLQLSLDVNRTFHSSTDSRSMGVALYPLTFEP
jgi:lysophospholipase L1-like esterase